MPCLIQKTAYENFPRRPTASSLYVEGKAQHSFCIRLLLSSSPLLWPAIKPFSATLKSKAHTNHTWPAYKHSIQIKHTTYSPRYPPQHFFLFIQRNLLVGAIALRVSTGQDLISIPMVLRIPFVHWIKPFQRYYTYSDTSHSILFIHIYCSHRTLLAHCELIALQVVLFCRAIE